MPTIPVITLLSDLGTGHHSISGTKVLLMGGVAGTEIVDISHRLTAYNLQQAAYLSSAAYRHFPANTVHLLLVDMMAGERHRMLLSKVDGHYFIAPDNGVLSLAFGARLREVWLCREFSEPVSLLQWVAYAGQVISVVSSGNDLNDHFSRFVVKEVAQIMMQKPIGARLDCTVMHIDRYGNIAIDLTRNRFDELVADGPFSIKLPRDKEITTISEHYNDVPNGELLCRFNSLGFMEIAINHGSATSAFEFDIATDKGMNYSVITVNF